MYAFFLERINGEGWWGAENMSDYYAVHEFGSDPFNWIKMHHLMDSEITTNYIFDHIGKRKTSLLMVLAPDRVDIDSVSGNKT